MSERALRGSRLGSSSYESDEGVDVVPRQQIPYECVQGHRFSVPFSIEAEVPSVWECRFCGAEATIANGDDPEPKQFKPPRTHWDMLLERREVADLEDLLHERLSLLRAEREALAAATSAAAARAQASAAAAPDDDVKSAKKHPAKAKGKSDKTEQSAAKKTASSKKAPEKKAPSSKEKPTPAPAAKKSTKKAES